MYVTSVNHTRDATGTANSETADEQTQESQALVPQTFPSDVLHLETIGQTGELRFQELAFTVGHIAKEKTPTLIVTQ